MKKASRKRDIRWFLFGFGTAFVIAALLVSFYTLRVIVPDQLNMAASFAETTCFSAACYQMLNISVVEYQQIQSSCRLDAEQALAMVLGPDSEIFFNLLTQNYNWVLILGAAFLIAGFIVLILERRSK
jgi:bacteriorhodopsin